MRTLLLWVVVIVAVVLFARQLPTAIDQTFADPPSVKGVDKAEIIRNLQTPRR